MKGLWNGPKRPSKELIPGCQDDDADTEAPTEESDYDPFAGIQAGSMLEDLLTRRGKHKPVNLRPQRTLAMPRCTSLKDLKRGSKERPRGRRTRVPLTR